MSINLIHGLYENCTPGHSQAIIRLQEMKDAGVRRVLNYWLWQGTEAEILNYAAQANNKGLQLIYPHNGTAAQIELVKNHPATWGFYIGEEAMGNVSKIQTIANYSSLVETAAPTAKKLYVEWGMNLFNLGPWLRDLVPYADMIAADYYPVGINIGSLAETTECAEKVKKVATNNDRVGWMVLQAFSWASEPELAPPGSHEWPTVTQMKEQKRRSENAGIQSMLWFNYYFIRPFDSTDYTKLDRLRRTIEEPD